MLHSRSKRVGETLKQALSTIFQQEMNDPRLPAIFTITHVEVSKDLRNATAYYSQLPDDENALDATDEMLEDSLGYVRGRVAQEVNLKFTPEIVFRYNPSEKHFQKINTILKTLDVPEDGDENEDQER